MHFTVNIYGKGKRDSKRIQALEESEQNLGNKEIPVGLEGRIIPLGYFEWKAVLRLLGSIQELLPSFLITQTV